MNNSERVNRAAATSPSPLELVRETIRTDQTRVKAKSATFAALLKYELVAARCIPVGLRVFVRLRQWPFVGCHTLVPQYECGVARKPSADPMDTGELRIKHLSLTALAA